MIWIEFDLSLFTLSTRTDGRDERELLLIMQVRSDVCLQHHSMASGIGRGFCFHVRKSAALMTFIDCHTAMFDLNCKNRRETWTKEAHLYEWWLIVSFAWLIYMDAWIASWTLLSYSRTDMYTRSHRTRTCTVVRTWHETESDAVAVRMSLGIEVPFIIMSINRRQCPHCHCQHWFNWNNIREGLIDFPILSIVLSYSLFIRAIAPVRLI
jgi:hypothetical protein